MDDEEQKRILQLLNESFLSGILSNPDFRMPPMSISEIFRNMSAPPPALADEKPPVTKAKRTTRTPHENPEALMKGTRVKKEVAGTILGLGERTIRKLIEEGKLQTDGAGYRQMVTVASIQARIKAKKKSA